MITLVPVLIVAWLGVAYVLFRKLPGPTAALVTVIAGQMFLPEVHPGGTETGGPPPLPLPIVKFTKANTIGYALLAGSLLTDWRRWRAARPRWFDLPVAAWCASPAFPAIINGIGPVGGLYEAGSQVLNQTVSWGVPYWCGRLYLGDRVGLRAAAAAFVLGGMVYVPLCLVEMRLSPQLHSWVYGYHQHEFVQAVRAGGYRPMVFMEHGLMVALWMTAAALAAFWLWHEGVFRVVAVAPGVRVGLGWVAAGLAGMVLLIHSAGAVVLGAGGAGALWAARRLRTAVPLWLLVLVPPAYVAARYTDAWEGRDLVALAEEFVGSDRAGSLDFRFQNEYKLVARARERPVFGWGDSGDARVIDSSGKDKVVTDSMWIIVAGSRGLFGLAAFLASLMTPVVLFLRADPPRRWTGPAAAPAAALAVCLSIYLLDHMVNAMVNPAFTLVAGGLAGAAGYLAPTATVDEWPADVGAARHHA